MRAFTDSGITFDIIPIIFRLTDTNKLAINFTRHGNFTHCEYYLEDFLNHTDDDHWSRLANGDRKYSIDAEGRNFRLTETVWVNYEEVCNFLEDTFKLLRVWIG